MDTADKLVNNRQPKKLIILYIGMITAIFISVWFISGFIADGIVKNQIKAMLAMSAYDENQMFTSLPEESAVIAGEKNFEQYGINANMNPRIMDCWKSIQKCLFWWIFGTSAVVCTIWLISALAQLFGLYNDMEKLCKSCIQIAEQKFDSAEMVGIPLDSIRRLSESINTIAERMSYLSYSLNSEKNFLKEFLSDFSHQLKTSLAVIHLNNDMLLELDNLSAEKRKMLSDEINDHLADMETLVISALKLAKLNINSVEYNMEVCSIDETCYTAVRRIAPILRDRNIKLNFEKGNCGDFLHDRIWLCEAIENIIKNSADHSQCTEVEVKTEHSPTCITISISDNGKGIPQSEIPKIFERFGKKSGDNTIKSAGIGMSVSKKVTEAHNGEIIIYSGKGKGTKIDLVFLKFLKN